MNIESAIYIVATPIGNLGDMTHRALEVLAQADLVAAEDTRQTRKLLDHYAITSRLLALHDHNELVVARELIARVQQGQRVALVSDAGTPLISDPGYNLVALAHDEGVRVVPIPGPSAVISALCVSGLACDRFVFEGFLPAKAQARLKLLQASMQEPRSLVFYESPHRILDTLMAMNTLFPQRRLTLARELTKRFETIRRATVAELLNWVNEDGDQLRGEFVLVLEGAVPEVVELASLRPALERVMQELPTKKAVSLVADLYGANKKALYDLALQIKAN